MILPKRAYFITLEERGTATHAHIQIETETLTEAILLANNLTRAICTATYSTVYLHDAYCHNCYPDVEVPYVAYYHKECDETPSPATHIDYLYRWYFYTPASAPMITDNTCKRTF